jgi:hypothetical protein
VIGNKDFDLTYLEEAYTSEHWLVRIYRVKKPHEFNRPALKPDDRVIPSSDYITKKVSFGECLAVQRKSFNSFFSLPNFSGSANIKAPKRRHQESPNSRERQANSNKSKLS